MLELLSRAARLKPGPCEPVSIKLVKFGTIGERKQCQLCWLPIMHLYKDYLPMRGSVSDHLMKPAGRTMSLM